MGLGQDFSRYCRGAAVRSAPAVAQNAAPASPTRTSRFAKSGAARAPAVEVRPACAAMRDCSACRTIKHARLNGDLKRAPLDGLAKVAIARMVEDALRHAPNRSLVPFVDRANLRRRGQDDFGGMGEIWRHEASVAGNYGPKRPRPKMLTPEHPDRRRRAPSLLPHVQAVAAVNPLYAQLRDAAGPDGPGERLRRRSLRSEARANRDTRRVPAGERARHGRQRRTAQLRFTRMAGGRHMKSWSAAGTKRRCSPAPSLVRQPYWNIRRTSSASGRARVVKAGSLPARRPLRVTADWTPAEPSSSGHDRLKRSCRNRGRHLRSCPAPGI